MKRAFFLLLLVLTGASELFSQSITSVSITGNPNVGSVLTGTWVADAGSGNHFNYEWFRSPSNTILSTGSVTYTILSGDEASNIYFKLSILRNSDDGLVISTSSSIVTINSFPVAKNVSIAGEARSGFTIIGAYTFSDVNGDNEGASAYQWYRSDYYDGSSAELIGTGSRSLKLTDNEINKYIGFSVIPAAQTGSSPGSMAMTSGTWFGPVINDPPEALFVSISGSKNVNGVLIGNYVYSDAEGDIESNSTYRWYSADSETGFYTPVNPAATTVAYGIKMTDQGRWFKFYITPNAASGTLAGAEKISPAFGPANTMPSASLVKIIGSARLDSTLRGRYLYSDPDLDPQGSSKFQWYRGTDPIPGAVDSLYKIVSDDVGSRIKFEVTPVSSTGYPDTGLPSQSIFTGTVTDPANNSPVATEVCIHGKRLEDAWLTGRYVYTNKYHEQGTTFFWYSGSTILKSGTSLDDKKYQLKSADLDKEIRFAVIPGNDKGQAGDIVFSGPLAIFTLPREIFSIADSSIVLTASPLGGVFSGKGVENGIFSPEQAGFIYSPHKITYLLDSINSDNTCIQYAYKDLYVNDIKTKFESFKDRYCQNEGQDEILVKNIPPGFNIMSFRLTDPKGIVIQHDSVAVIDPRRMRAGNKEDTLFFTASSLTTTIQIFRPFVIDSIAQVSIQNLDTGAVFCDNTTPFELFVSHPGGTFEGPVTDSIMDPSLALGDTLVKYTYISRFGCASSVSVPIRINPSPKTNFSVADYCISSESDTTMFINSTVSSDPVINWQWEFSDAGGSTSSSRENPGYLYKTGGLHKVTLTATSSNNCSVKREETIDLGVKPRADFYWENECFHPSDSLWLFDKTLSTSLIASRSWNFFDGDSLHTIKNPRYPKKSTGYLPVEYIVRTNYKDCHDTVTRSIYIRPAISLTSNDYFEQFENGNGGWVKDYEIINNWSFGKPDRPVINSAASGNNAWYTGYRIDSQKIESSAIISPCFDFTTIQRPMISLKLWKRFDQNRDGAALQYKIGDLPGWHYVGTLDDGINWYNSTLIQGRPGGDQIGWTSKTQKENSWNDAKHKLDELAGKKDVKFRIAYGSNGTSQDNDGLAFDDIWIGSRTRGVLLEHFTNFSSSSPSSFRAKIVSDLANRAKEDIINIQYHTNFPGTDPFYNDNPGDAGARFLFYGLSRVPYSIIDGGTGLLRNNYANISDYLIADIDSNDLTRRSLITPSFSINLNSVISGGILSITGQVKALEAINSENVTLYLAVTEKKSTSSTPDATGETEFFNVFRKFIPDAGGISLKKIWNLDETVPVSERTWKIEKIPNGADIEVIAFIQNNITKEVYQAESNLTKIVVGIDNLFAGNGKGFALYPNPAGKTLTVEFEKVTEAYADILIYSFSGTLIRSYRAGAGETEFTIDDMNLNNGIYLVRISSQGLTWGLKKLIISKN